MVELFCLILTLGLIIAILRSPIFWFIFIVAVIFLLYKKKSTKDQEENQINSALTEFNEQKNKTDQLWKTYKNKRETLYIYTDLNWLHTELFSLDFDVKFEIDTDIQKQLSGLSLDDKLNTIKKQKLDLELIETSIKADEIVFDELVLGLFLSNLTNENTYELIEYTDSFNTDDYFKKSKLYEKITTFTSNSVMYILALREFYTFGMVKVFTFDTLSSLSVLKKIIKLPIISPETIFQNNYVENIEKAKSVYSLLEYLHLTTIEDISDYDYTIPELRKASKPNRDTVLHCILVDVLFKFATGEIENKPNTLKISDELSKVKNGFEFEQYVASVLSKNNFTDIKLTPKSNDYGVDIIAVKDRVIYAFQCKFYSSPVGNHAIQEVYSGKEYYHANIGIVVTNNTFTKQAENQAKSSGIILWDGEYLAKLSNEKISLKNDDSNIIYDDSLPNILDDCFCNSLDEDEKQFIFYPISYLWYDDGIGNEYKLNNNMDNYCVLFSINNTDIDINLIKLKNIDNISLENIKNSFTIEQPIISFALNDTVISSKRKKVELKSTFDLTDDLFTFKEFLDGEINSLMKLRISKKDIEKAKDAIRIIKDKNSCYKI